MEREIEERKKENILIQTITKEPLIYKIKIRPDVFLFYSWKTWTTYDLSLNFVLDMIGQKVFKLVFYAYKG